MVHPGRLDRSGGVLKRAHASRFSTIGRWPRGAGEALGRGRRRDGAAASQTSRLKGDRRPRRSARTLGVNWSGSTGTTRYFRSIACLSAPIPLGRPNSS